MTLAEILNISGTAKDVVFLAAGGGLVVYESNEHGVDSRGRSTARSRVMKVRPREEHGEDSRMKVEVHGEEKKSSEPLTWIY